MHQAGNTITIGDHAKKAYFVQGRPFIEDLSHVHPAHRLIVELVDPAKSIQRLTPELLFREFRQFGKLQDIEVDAKK